MSGGPRGLRSVGRAAASAVSAALLVAALAGAGPAAAQEGDGPRAVARLQPDTVRIGEPFLLAVTVRAGEGATVVFPRVVSGGAAVEQVEPVETREAESGARRAYYRLVAWRAGEVDLPAVEVDLGEAGRVAARPPALVVRSVLPEGAEADTLELREARPYLQAAGLPWLWLAAALAVAAAAWWLYRRRGESAEGAAGPGVTERALLDLARLRDEWRAGALTTASFFDRFESILRRFGGEAFGWPAGWPLRGLVGDEPELSGALERSALVRFARVRAVDRAVLAAVEAGREWVRRDRDSGEAP